MAWPNFCNPNPNRLLFRRVQNRKSLGIGGLRSGIGHPYFNIWVITLQIKQQARNNTSQKNYYNANTNLALDEYSLIKDLQNIFNVKATALEVSLTTRKTYLIVYTI